ncbi:YitT family protein [Ureibacillus composti]|nr:YitT family protein [Ureibacillus composti]
MYIIKKGLSIILGSFFVAIGVNVFITPYQILDGGVIGLALILHYLYHWQIGLMLILLSIPIFMIAWFKYRSFFYNSLHGLLISSFIIDLLKPLETSLQMFQIDGVVSAILGGFFVGLGIGIMLRHDTSTGGTDLLAQFISDKTKVNVGIIIFFIDSAVVTLGGILLSTSTLLLSIITILVVGFTTSVVTIKKGIT